MSNLSNLDPSIIYALLKGEPGTRKSTAALSFPKPQYWFSWDKKMRALLLPMKYWGIDPTHIEYDDYTDWEAGRRKLEQFQVNCKFKTLIVDSITSLGDSINRQTLKLKSGTTTQSGKEAGKRIAGIPVNTIEDFNAETSALQELIALTKDIAGYHKINIILIAHVIQTEQRSPDGETHMSRLIVTGGKKIAAKIPAYCDEIYHFNIILIAHVIQTEQRSPDGETHMSRLIVTGGKKIAAKIPAYCDEIYHFQTKSGFVAGAGGDYSLLTQHTGDDYARTSLPLDKEIVIKNDPLYDKYLIPAIKKMQESPEKVVKL